MSKIEKKILLAEPDVETAKPLGKALKDAGMEVFYSKDGPRALELAIRSRPDIILTEIELPYLNAVKIAQILRSNPNVRDVPIIFFTEGDINPVYQPFFRNAVIKKPFNVDQVLTKVEGVIFKEEKSREVQREAKEIEGNLTQMSLVDIFQIFSMNKKSGVLALRREDIGEEGMVFLKDGEIINATINNTKGEKALYRLLGWETGKFAYIPQDFHPEVTIEKSTDSLLMEGMRQIDEWKKMEKEFPPLDSIVALKIDPNRLTGGLRPVTKDVIALLSFYDTVKDILNNCAYPDYEVMMTIHTLISKGIVAINHKGGGRKKAAKPLFSSEEAFAIKERVKSRFRDVYDIDTIKIPVIADNYDDIRRFANILTKIDGFNLEKDFFDSEGKFPPFGFLGSIKLNENITLLFTVFPMDRAYYPLWSPFMGDSLGALVLRSSDIIKNSISALIGRLKDSLGLKSATVSFAPGEKSLDAGETFNMNVSDIEKDEGGKALHNLVCSFLNN